jgi:hypothetical protein
LYLSVLNNINKIIIINSKYQKFRNIHRGL